MAITIPANMRSILKDAIADDGYLQIRLESTGSGTGGTGVSDHGLLTGLSDDDHTQYLTQGRGDARYYTESEIDGLLSGLSPDHGNLTGLSDDDHTQYHTDARGDARYSVLLHTHDTRYYTEVEIDQMIGTELPAGITSISGTADRITITFDEQPNDDYDLFLALENTVDATPSHYTMLITNKTQTSFTVRFSGNLDSAGYKLNWAIGKFSQGASEVYAHGELSGLDQDDHLQYLLRTDFTTYSGSLQSQIDTKATITQLTTTSGALVSYTDSVVSTLSGSLQSQIAGLGDEYATDAELASVSGVLQGEINDKSDVGHSHNDLYYTEGEVDTISGALNSKISTVSGSLQSQIDNISPATFDYGTVLTVNNTYKGEIMTVQVDDGTTLAGRVLVQGTDFNYDQADADLVAGAGSVVLALEDGSGTKTVLIKGQYCNTGYSWSAGKLYVSTTLGEMTQTKPSGSGDQIEVLGWALSATCIFFDPDRMVAEVA
jgi:hypothetical protein